MTRACRFALLVGLAVAAANPTSARSAPLPQQAQGPGAVPSLMERPAGLTVDGVGLKEALQELTRSSRVPIAFSPSLLPLRTVSCACATVSLQTALERLTEGTTLEYVEVAHQIVIFSSARASADAGRSPAGPDVTERRLPFQAMGRSVSGRITGRVSSAVTGEPLAAVQVYIAGSGIGALTQQDGRYVLLDIPNGVHVVIAERIGHRRVTRQVVVVEGGRISEDFRLDEEALGLDEIVVTGTPGGTQRRAVGNSVLTVSAATLNQSGVQADMKDLLRGRIPGIALGAGSGIGQGADITIRGVGSFDRRRSNPIVFVDGVRINTAPSGPTMAGQGQPRSNPLDDFNPAEIESIEIIKGPAAATLYGTEASAGVIQIITKKGREGAPTFTVSLMQGRVFNRAPQDKLGTMWTCNDGLTVPCAGGLDAVTPYPFLHNLNYALDVGTYNRYWSHEYWPQENLFQYGPSHGYNVEARGGSDRVRYFLSGNTERTEGPQHFNWDVTNRVRANVGVVFSEQFTLDVATGYIDGTTSYDAQAGARGGTWDQIVWGFGYCTPLVSVHEPEPGTSAPNCSRTLGFQQFLPTDQAPIVSTRDYDRFTGSAALNFNAGRWLSARAILGVDKGWDKNYWMHPVERLQSNVILERAKGQVVLERVDESNVSFDASATITKQIGMITTGTSFGGQVYSKSHELLRNTGIGFTVPEATTINQTPSLDAGLVYEYLENKSLGVYVQEQLGWRDRVFLTGAVRFDDNSAFGANFDPLIYPKLSAAWVVSEEGFWPFRFVDQLRVRGAWGEAGRQPDTFAGVNTFNVVAGPGGTSALSPSSSGNKDVGPEKSTEIEFGFDASLLEGRIAGAFSWYRRINRDNLLPVSEPVTMGGYGSMQRNIGKLKNWGWEAALDTRVFEGETLKLDLGFTGAYKMNEILDIGEYAGSNNLKIGWPYPNRTGQYTITRAEYDPEGPIVLPNGERVQMYCEAGVLPAAALHHPDPAQRNPVRSRYGAKLGGGDEVPCQTQMGTRTLWGPAFSPYSWSVSPRITLRNTIQLSALVDGQYGGLGEDLMSVFHHRYNNAFGALLQDDPMYAGRYRLENWAGGAYYRRDFWKLREVSVRYQLPPSWLAHIGADRGALTFSGHELAVLWTSSTGSGIHPDQRAIDLPPAGILDVDYGRSAEGDGNHRSSPPMTSFNLRLEVTF